jgi:hypothetical protein
LKIQAVALALLALAALAAPVPAASPAGSSATWVPVTIEHTPLLAVFLDENLSLLAGELSNLDITGLLWDAVRVGNITLTLHFHFRRSSNYTSLSTSNVTASREGDRVILHVDVNIPDWVDLHPVESVILAPSYGNPVSGDYVYLQQSVNARLEPAVVNGKNLVRLTITVNSSTLAEAVPRDAILNLMEVPAVIQAVRLNLTLAEVYIDPLTGHLYAPQAGGGLADLGYLPLYTYLLSNYSTAVAASYILLSQAIAVLESSPDTFYNAVAAARLLAGNDTANLQRVEEAAREASRQLLSSIIYGGFHVFSGRYLGYPSHVDITGSLPLRIEAGGPGNYSVGGETHYYLALRREGNTLVRLAWLALEMLSGNQTAAAEAEAIINSSLLEVRPLQPQLPDGPRFFKGEMPKALALVAPGPFPVLARNSSRLFMLVLPVSDEAASLVESLIGVRPAYVAMYLPVGVDVSEAIASLYGLHAFGDHCTYTLYHRADMPVSFLQQACVAAMSGAVLDALSDAVEQAVLYGNVTAEYAAARAREELQLAIASAREACTRGLTPHAVHEAVRLLAEQSGASLGVPVEPNTCQPPSSTTPGAQGAASTAETPATHSVSAGRGPQAPQGSRGREAALCAVVAVVSGASAWVLAWARLRGSRGVRGAGG